MPLSCLLRSRERTSIVRAAGILIVVVFGGVHTAAGVVRTDVKFDRTLGGRASRLVPDAAGGIDVPAARGRSAGANLLHSFERLSVGAGTQVRFGAATTPVDHLIVRVTGGRPLQLAGTLDASALGAAQVWLLSPAGLQIEGGGRLIAGGATHLSTADALTFADGRSLAAAGPGAAAPTLSAAPPASFGFLSAKPASIRLTGDRSGDDLIALSSPGNPLTLAGGDVTLDGARLDVFDTALRIVALDSPGSVTPGALDARGAPLAKAARLGALRITGNGQIASQSTDATLDNTLRMAAGVFDLSGGIDSVPAIQSTADAAGAAGDIVLRGGLLNMTGGGRIFSVAGGAIGSGSLSAGTIDVSVDRVWITGPTVDAIDAAPSRAAAARAGLYSFVPADSGGAGGAIRVKAREMTVSQLGALATSTDGTGPAGGIDVRAANLRLDGSDINGDNAFTGITAAAQGTGLLAVGGNVRVRVAGLLAIERGAAIASNTFGEARGGEVAVRAAAIDIRGPGDESNTTGVLATSLAARGAGQGGGIAVRATDAVRLFARGKISAEAAGDGAGGNISVVAPRLELAGGDVLAASAGGDAGTVRIETSDTLRLTRAATLRASAPRGEGGNVSVAAGRVSASGASIVSATALANGGNIDMQARQTVLAAGGSRIEAGSASADQPTVNGGVVTLSGAAVAISDASLVASAVAGGGGSVTLTGSPIVQGQNVTVDVSSVFGQSGTFITTSPIVDITAGLVGLVGEVFDPALVLTPECAALLGTSSFILDSRGGVAGDLPGVPVSPSRP